jgi:hypothetical protein
MAGGSLCQSLTMLSTFFPYTVVVFAVSLALLISSGITTAKGYAARFRLLQTIEN